MEKSNENHLQLIEKLFSELDLAVISLKRAGKHIATAHLTTEQVLELFESKLPGDEEHKKHVELHKEAAKAAEAPVYIEKLGDRQLRMVKITSAQYKEITEAFPSINVAYEVQKADYWCSTSGVRGQKKNWVKFLRNWMLRVSSTGTSYTESAPKKTLYRGDLE